MENGFAPGRLLIKDIGYLVGFGKEPLARLSGGEMHGLPVIGDAWLAIEDGRVMDGGAMADFPGIVDWNGLEVVEASGRCVLPAWVDSHTHLVHAASREGEFVDRIRGLTYQEIAARGGGILNSAEALRAMSEEALYATSLERMERLMRMGTGAIEVKSGYGLDLESELKMLRVARRLGALDRIPVKTTFLGCHAVPAGWNSAAEYTQYMIKEVLPAVVEEGLADHVDIFCEEGYFGLEETRMLLEAARLRGLPAKVHVNQFKASGGVPLCVELGAMSVDHLEVLAAEDVAELSAAETIPVALPLCSLFLDLPFTPGRTLVDAGCALAIATDFNPGSAPSGNMHLAAALGCLRMGLEPREALAAATVNGAAALGLSSEVGGLAVGQEASLMLTRPLRSVEEALYAFGDPIAERVLLRGHWLD
jgi:imidazolonepropionase